MCNTDYLYLIYFHFFLDKKTKQKNQGRKSLTKNYQRYGNDLKIHIRSLNHLYPTLFQFY